ncbi:multidrug effflux MFS transporter [Eikenella sp. S3360]|uniref:Bcr/CflA family efflux transporter n=1 Tax=Eikenella glucosivorans TaxID=2766967 RepID=A0ABS0N9G6_9NEIS|nr:multidrug effflux MFS transporter [Eikenella glucosivorans]MBH5328935.1 multidrug effflux MFS transporter [Eikenella glucosivorans]
MPVKKYTLEFLLILSALMAFTSLSVDIYLPALPEMSRDLNGDAELTVTGFLVGFALAQLVWGPISDRIGRKVPLLIGMLLFVVGSVGCALSESLEAVVFWRVFQAFGACVAPMLSRAMVRDLFGSTQAAQLLSTLMMIMAAAPIVGPLIGGLLVKIASWHAHFWLLTAIGALMFFAVFRLPESLPPRRRAEGSVWAAFAGYKDLLANRVFMRYTLCVTFFYVAAYAFITGSPKVYIDYFHVAPEYYGFWFGANIVGVMAMSALNRRLVGKFALPQLLRGATLIAAAAALLVAAAAFLKIGGIWGIALPVFAVFSMNGIIAACANAAALASVDSKSAGSAAALIGSLQYGSGIVSTLLLAAFSDGTPSAMAWVIAVFVGLSAVMAWPGRQRKPDGFQVA